MAFFTLKGPAEWEKDRFGRLWTELFVIFPAEILVLWCFIMFYYIYIYIYIWVNYISPTWIQAILGIIPLTNYDYSEVAVRSLLFTHIYIYIYTIVHQSGEQTEAPPCTNHFLGLVGKPQSPAGGIPNINPNQDGWLMAGWKKHCFTMPYPPVN